MSPFNFFGSLVASFVGLAIIEMSHTYIVFLMGSPDHYNIPENEISKTYGDIAFYNSLVLICGFDICIGFLYDTIGRRWTLGFGVIIASISTAVMPLASSIYPGLLLLR